MVDDVFKVREVLDLQEKILTHLQGCEPDDVAVEPDDVAVKIAALRASADLLQQTVNMAIITASFKSLMGQR